MNTRRIVLGVVLAATLSAWTAAAASVGLAVGFDPTGLMLISAMTETSINESLDLRAEAGIASDEIAGLMLATGTVLYHYPLPPVDPYVGLGGGIAMTPPPFATGIVAEGVAGLRAEFTPVISIFGQIRFLVRWSGEGITTGPIFEAGFRIRF